MLSTVCAQGQCDRMNILPGAAERAGPEPFELHDPEFWSAATGPVNGKLSIQPRVSVMVEPTDRSGPHLPVTFRIEPQAGDPTAWFDVPHGIHVTELTLQSGANGSCTGPTIVLGPTPGTFNLVVESAGGQLLRVEDIRVSGPPVTAHYPDNRGFHVFAESFSSQLRIRLLDTDGNVVANQPVRLSVPQWTGHRFAATDTSTVEAITGSDGTIGYTGEPDFASMIGFNASSRVGFFPIAVESDGDHLVTLPAEVLAIPPPDAIIDNGPPPSVVRINQLIHNTPSVKVVNSSFPAFGIKDIPVTFELNEASGSFFSDVITNLPAAATRLGTRRVVTTSAGGRADAGLVYASDVGGIITLTVTVQGIDQPLVFKQVVESAAQRLLLSDEPDRVAAPGQACAPVTVSVTDDDGNPVARQLVTVRTDDIDIANFAEAPSVEYVSDIGGQVIIDSLAAGVRPGETTVTVESGDIEPTTFRVASVPPRGPVLTDLTAHQTTLPGSKLDPYAVRLLGHDDAPVVGTEVTVTVSGPADFRGGRTVMKAFTNVVGIAVFPGPRSTGATGLITASARADGASAIELADRRVTEPTSALTAEATSAALLIDGQFTLETTVTNTNDFDIAALISSRYGRRSIESLPPGESATVRVCTGLGSISPGTVNIRLINGERMNDIRESYRELTS